MAYNTLFTLKNAKKVKPCALYAEGINFKIVCLFLLSTKLWRTTFGRVYFMLGRCDEAQRPMKTHKWCKQNLLCCCCYPVVAKSAKTNKIFYASEPILWSYHDPVVDLISKLQYSNGKFGGKFVNVPKMRPDCLLWSHLWDIYNFCPKLSIWIFNFGN